MYIQCRIIKFPWIDIDYLISYNNRIHKNLYKTNDLVKRRGIELGDQYCKLYLVELKPQLKLTKISLSLVRTNLNVVRDCLRAKKELHV